MVGGLVERFLSHRRDVAGQVISSHVLHRLAPEQAHAVELTSTAQHLGEPEVVPEGGDEARPAREGGHIVEVSTCSGRLEQGESATLRRPVETGQAIVLVLGHLEPGVDHPERFQDVLGEEAVEALSREDFHQVAEHVGGDAVVPALSGMVDQGNPGESRDHLRERSVGGEEIGAPFAIEARDGMIVVEPVGEPGAVGEQLVDGDGTPRGLAFHLLALARNVDPQIAEGRDVPADGIFEPEASLLVEHHRRDRGHRLGHRVEAHEVAGLEAPPLFEVRVARRRHPGDLARARDEDAGARELAVVHVGLHPGTDALQAFAAQADRFRGRGGLHRFARMSVLGNPTIMTQHRSARRRERAPMIRMSGTVEGRPLRGSRGRVPPRAGVPWPRVPECVRSTDCPADARRSNAEVPGKGGFAFLRVSAQARARALRWPSVLERGDGGRRCPTRRPASSVATAI